MQKKLVSLNILLTVFMLVIICGSCGSDDKDKTTDDSKVVEKVKQFSVGNYNFAILENTKFIPYNKAIYHRGDEVYLVLQNVGPFQRGKDSLNNAQMKLEVTNSIGEVILLDEKVFKSHGHKDLPNNMLREPYAMYPSSQNNKPGKYTMTVTIYDLLKNDSLVVSDDFFIE